jgi:hypothetical protein
MALAFSSFGNYLDGARSQWRPTENRLKTCRGILHRLWRHSLRLLCQECGEMSFISDIVDCADAPNSMVLDCLLSCSHPRNLTIAVRAEVCDRCDARWMKDQWAHETGCKLRKLKEASERRTIQ